MYVYHYHIKCSDQFGTRVNEIDEIFSCEEPIVNMEKYEKIRRLICDQFEQSYENSTIISLSLLHSTAEQNGS